MTFRILISISFLALLSFTNFENSYLSNPTTSAYIDSTLNLFKWIVDNDSTDEKIISNSLSYSYDPVSFFGITICDSAIINNKKICLTALDTLFMKNVKEQIKECLLPGQLSKKALIISSDSVKQNKEFSKKYLTFSLPYFSSNYNIAFIEKNNICLPECGTGEVLVCMRIKNEWKIIFRTITWIN